MGEFTTFRRLAKRMAEETRRKAQTLSVQANQEYCLAKLQPWPENGLTHISAQQKVAKANRLRNIAQRFERAAENVTGLGSHPGPVVMFRSKAAQ